MNKYTLNFPKNELKIQSDGQCGTHFVPGLIDSKPEIYKLLNLKESSSSILILDFDNEVVLFDDNLIEVAGLNNKLVEILAAFGYELFSISEEIGDLNRLINRPGASVDDLEKLFDSWD